MKRSDKYSNLRTSLIVALVLSIIIGILLPVKHQKYKSETINHEKVTQSLSTHYIDWDQDGLSEFVKLGNVNSRGTIKTGNNRDNTDKQHNLKGNLIGNVHKAIFDDYDHDGFLEMFFLTQNHDSLFLNALDFATDSLILDHEFMETVPLVEGKNDFGTRLFLVHDNNNDGFKEVYFSISGRLSIKPRKLYCFDLKKGKLIKTMESYSMPKVSNVLDIDGDGTPEIICDNSSPANSKNLENIPFSDTLNWVFVFNDKLVQKFKAVKIEGHKGKTSVKPLKTETGYKLLCLFSEKGDGNTDFLMLMDINGEELKKLYLPATISNITHRLIQIDESYKNYLLVLSDGTEYIINENFKLKKKLKNDEFLNTAVASPIRIDGNKSIYFLRNPRQDNIALSTIDLKSIVKLDIPANSGSYNISVKKNQGENHILFQNPTDKYLVSFEKNKLYYISFGIYPGLFILIFLMSNLVLNSQQSRIVRQYETEKRLSELQFQNIKNQLNPHFTFNVLNSIGLMVKSGESDDAYNYLSKNARMIRRLLEDANKITISLKSEISFVEDYLALQHMRFKERYSENISIDDGVNPDIKVPKMIIHTYVENAIKHGLARRAEGGILDIRIKKISKNQLKFIISDNGPGMDSAGDENSTGKGMNVMQEYYNLFEKYYSYKIVFNTDIPYPDDKLFPGTRVIIKITLPDA